MVIKFNALNKKSNRSLKEGLLDYLNTLIKYKWLLIIITGIAAVGVIVFSIVSIVLPPEKSPSPNLYTANAILLIAEEEQGSLSNLFYSLGIAPANQRSMYDYGTLAFRILTTRSFIDEVVREFKIDEKYKIPKEDIASLRSAVLGRTEYTYDRNTRSLTFSYTDISPVFAKDILYKMVELLINWFTNQGSTNKTYQIGVLAAKLDQIEVEIASLETKIKDFQRKHNVLSVDEMATTQTEILSNLRTQLIIKEIELANYTKFSLIEDSVKLRLKSEQKNLLDTIQQVENGYTGEGKFMPSREELPELALEFTKLNSDLEIQRRIYETLSQQYEVSKLTTDIIPKYQVLEWPEIPREKSGPIRSQIILIVILGAFAFSCGLVFLIDILKNIRIVRNDEQA